MNATRFLAPIVALVAIVPALAVACGDDDDAPEATATPTTEVQSQVLEITGAWARASLGNDVSAVYFTVTNPGDQADRLVAATSEASPTIEIHEVVTEGSMSKMQELPDGLEIPADSSVELKPGGYHVMMLDLPEPLVEDQVIRLTLVFEHAGELEIEVPVKAADTGGGIGH